jgi:hypothetical protein
VTFGNRSVWLVTFDDAEGTLELEPGAIEWADTQLGDLFTRPELKKVQIDLHLKVIGGDRFSSDWHFVLDPPYGDVNLMQEVQIWLATLLKLIEESGKVRVQLSIDGVNMVPADIWKAIGQSIPEE